MLRMLFFLSPMLAGCAATPQKAAMPTDAPSSSTSVPAAARMSGSAGAAGHRPDTPAEAQGRRILSTAFVNLGPDGHLTVELRDGRAVVLTAVAMNPTDYCGTPVIGDAAGPKFCGRYADVVAARPGGGPTAERPNLDDHGAVEMTGNPS